MTPSIKPVALAFALLLGVAIAGCGVREQERAWREQIRKGNEAAAREARASYRAFVADSFQTTIAGIPGGQSRTSFTTSDGRSYRLNLHPRPIDSTAFEEFARPGDRIEKDAGSIYLYVVRGGRSWEYVAIKDQRDPENPGPPVTRPSRFDTTRRGRE